MAARSERWLKCSNDNEMLACKRAALGLGDTMIGGFVTCLWKSVGYRRAVFFFCLSGRERFNPFNSTDFQALCSRLGCFFFFVLI